MVLFESVKLVYFYICCCLNFCMISFPSTLQMLARGSNKISPFKKKKTNKISPFKKKNTVMLNLSILIIKINLQRLSSRCFLKNINVDFGSSIKIINNQIRNV